MVPAYVCYTPLHSICIQKCALNTYICTNVVEVCPILTTLKRLKIYWWKRSKFLVCPKGSVVLKLMWCCRQTRRGELYTDWVLSVIIHVYHMHGIIFIPSSFNVAILIIYQRIQASQLPPHHMEYTLACAYLSTLIWAIRSKHYSCVLFPCGETCWRLIDCFYPKLW